jgi:hypothetical protein
MHARDQLARSRRIRTHCAGLGKRKPLPGELALKQLQSLRVIDVVPTGHVDHRNMNLSGS